MILMDQKKKQKMKIQVGHKQCDCEKSNMPIEDALRETFLDFQIQGRHYFQPYLNIVSFFLRSDSRKMNS